MTFRESCRRARSKAKAKARHDRFWVWVLKHDVSLAQLQALEETDPKLRKLAAQLEQGLDPAPPIISQS